jgi:hypothetical protein
VNIQSPIFLLLGLFLLNQSALAQKNSEPLLIAKDSIFETDIDPLAPSKAAFYSAILPGLGQAYNKRYWKIPLVYGGLAAGLYFYTENNKSYKEFRDVYKRRLEGFTDDKYPEFSNTVLINAQRLYQRNRNISLFVTIGIYVLNIVDANVDAHLLQFNISDSLSFGPDIYPINDFSDRQTMGLTLNFKF